MLFSSHVFLLAFLPVTLAVYVWLDRSRRDQWSIGWLVLASLFFYGWWNPPYVLLILASIAVNYLAGRALGRLRARGDTARLKLLLTASVGVNLAVLGYYKYWNFLLQNLGWVTGSAFETESIFLPLGISFFTFQQIAYLVDAYAGQTEEYDFWRYALFVTFFPQLIAGPIVHHKEVLPQFAQRAAARIRPELLVMGLTLLAIGLFKKTVLADGVAPLADAAFALAAKGQPLSLSQAWTGVLAYTMQIYFDFSGYSDMAVGLGWLFGITLPINFFSPYKADNIIEFWRRWHITLSRFLRDYLYIPLGGNRKGELRRYENLLLTMLLGGLWHGAGWTFVIWGGLHGVYLAINHLWRAALARAGVPGGRATGMYWPARILTFLAVTVTWVFFRADSFAGALRMLEGMIGLGGGRAVEWSLSHALLALLLAAAWWAPNSLEFCTAAGPVAHPEVHRSDIRYPAWMLWRPTRAWAVVTGLAASAGLLYTVRDLRLESPFLYFQF